MSEILLVDDEQGILDSIRRMLGGRYALHTALSGNTALAALGSNPGIRVMVADMRMPGMNGLELLRIAQEKYPNVVRIMLTANVDRKTALDAVDEGHVFHFLTKPCDEDTLVRAIETALQLSRLDGQIDQIGSFLRNVA